MIGLSRPTAPCAAMMLFAGMLLAGCATRMPRSELPPPLSDPQSIKAAEADQSQRAQWLHPHRQWSFEGRVAINNAGKGGNGRIDWRQEGARYVVSLSAPVTRQSWRLSGDTHSEAGRLEGLEGGPREGEDAEALLLEATGWDIPVNALAEWVRGLPAEGFPSEGQSFSSEGRLRSVEQAGWRIEYLEWFDSVGGQPTMPRRIEASRGTAKVRLIIDQWSFASP
ncbi:MAG TPA: lipoprotein insertase outer membrane protein LolB [Pseudoxanthomonas sp.]